MKFLIMHFSLPPATSCLLGPNILLSTLFSNVLNQGDRPSYILPTAIQHSLTTLGTVPRIKIPTKYVQ